MTLGMLVYVMFGLVVGFKKDNRPVMQAMSVIIPIALVLGIVVFQIENEWRWDGNFVVHFGRWVIALGGGYTIGLVIRGSLHKGERV